MKRYFFLLLAAATLLSTDVFAREVYQLNDGWLFFFKRENSSDNARMIKLPHTWNTDAQSGTITETTANYLNQLYIPDSWQGKRIFVRFYGVQQVGDFFVNGLYVGSHYGSGTAFTFELTERLRYGTENALMMVVSNAHRNDVLPLSTDANCYGGIYREAELIVTEKTLVSPLYLGTEGVLVHQKSVTRAAAKGELELHLHSTELENCLLTVTFTDARGKQQFFRRQRVHIDPEKPLMLPYEVEQPDRWSPANPALYTVRVRLEDNDNLLDEVCVKTGFRSVQATSAGALRINDDSLRIHGVTLYHDNALSGGLLTDEDYEADLKDIRTLGANAIRSALMPHGQYLYDRCDETGMMVWVDSPLHHSGMLSDLGFYPTKAFQDNGRQQLKEIIAQNINHPSVIMWGLFSRLRARTCDDAVPYVRELNILAHKMDPSRLTVACSDQDGPLNYLTDLIVWRQEVGWDRGSADDLQVWCEILQSEWSHLHSAISYGAYSIIGHGGAKQTDATAASNVQPEERQTRFHEDYARNLQTDSLLWGTWIETMFDYGASRRTYGLNARGLVSLNRRDRKDAYYLYKALWNSEQPTLHLVDKRTRIREGEEQVLRVYSSAGAPLMLVGRDTVTLNEVSRCQYRTDTLRLQGRVEVKVSAGGLHDSATFEISNSLKSRRLQAPLKRADQ